MIVWITGLSGAGKTTLAQETVNRLKASGKPAVLLDGDEVRWVIQDPTVQHDRESRLTNAYRISRLAQLLESQGLIVVVATMSLFHEIHAHNRQNFEAYLEVWLDVDLPTLQQRDPKGVYQRLAEGQEKNVTGLDIPAEFPKTPHLVINNIHPEHLQPGVEKILDALAIGHPALTK